MSTAGAGAGEMDSRAYRTELIRGDVAGLVGVELGDAPGGGPVTWELSIDAARVAVTDEAMTDQAALGWARRMLGEGVVFWPGHLGGGYWVANPDELAGREHASRVGRGWVW